MRSAFYFAAHNDCSNTMPPQSAMDEGSETVRLLQNSGS